MRIGIISCGTGGSRLLKGFFDFRKTLDIRVIVNTTDNGGHSGELRKIDPRIIAVGDFRNLLCASSTNTRGEEWNQRDEQGHSIGNLALFERFKKCNDFDKVASWANKELATFADIYPATLVPADIAARYQDGKIVVGEWQIIDYHSPSPIDQMYLVPPVEINPQVLSAVDDLDAIIISPGAIHTGIVSVLLAKGLREKLSKLSVRIIYVANLMSFPGGTNGLTGLQQVGVIEKYLGRKIDVVLANNGEISEQLIKHYAEFYSHPLDWSVVDERIHFVDFIPSRKNGFLELERIGKFKKWTHLLVHDPVKTVTAIWQELNLG